jgi:hypothetical protein
LIATSELRRIEKNLLPSLVLARARAQSRAAFARSYAGTLMLMVPVDDANGDLGRGLLESTAEVPPAAPTRDRIGFSTEMDRPEMSYVVTSMLPPPPPIDHVELRKRLLVKPHFALPIRKREAGASAKPFSGKVSVGRARNNDIVLRHPTVSKFHAWFDVVDDKVYVTDARSKNHTWMFGEALAPNEPRLVEPGVQVRFGRVTTIAVTPDVLWKATIGDDD